MNKRVLAYGMVLLMVTGLLFGCGKKKVDSEFFQEGTERISTDSLAALKNLDTWKDSWTYVDADGKEQTALVDAKIIVPDIEHMSVIEVERAGNNPDFQTQVMKTFFENGEIYYHDEEHYTKEELTESIEIWEEYKAKAENAEEAAFYDEYIQRYQQMLETAPDDYVKADAFENCDTYIGYREDIPYTAYMDEVYVSFMAENIKDICPKSLCDFEYVATMEDYKSSTGTMLENECSLSEEEAMQIAESFLNEIGRNRQVCIEIKPLVWYGENPDGSKNYVFDGYRISYGTGIDGMAFSEFPDFANYDVAHTKPDIKDTELYNGDQVTMHITDDGIVDVIMKDPVIIRNESNEVTLLPLDTIEDILKTEISKNSQKYDFTWESEFDELRLMYLKMKDDTDENVFSYIPVWCLSRQIAEDVYYHPVFVNAMDGSVIYILE